MTRPPSVKVLCGRCGRPLCRVTPGPGGPDYRLAGRGGGTASGPAGVACPDHGWPDLADPALTAKLGRAAAHRAKMLPRPPIPQ